MPRAWASFSRSNRTTRPPPERGFISSTPRAAGPTGPVAKEGACSTSCSATRAAASEASTRTITPEDPPQGVEVEQEHPADQCAGGDRAGDVPPDPAMDHRVPPGQEREDDRRQDEREPHRFTDETGHHDRRGPQRGRQRCPGGASRPQRDLIRSRGQGLPRTAHPWSSPRVVRSLHVTREARALPVPVRIAGTERCGLARRR